MKSLNECKEYYKDVFMDCLDSGAFEAERTEFGKIEYARFNELSNALKFIYGDNFERIDQTWGQEALNYYYSHIDK